MLLLYTLTLVSGSSTSPDASSAIFTLFSASFSCLRANNSATVTGVESTKVEQKTCQSFFSSNREFITWSLIHKLLCASLINFRLRLITLFLVYYKTIHTSVSSSKKQCNGSPECSVISGGWWMRRPCSALRGRK